MTHQLEELYHDIQQTVLAEYYNPSTGALTLPDFDHDPVIQLIAQHDTELLNEVEEKLLSYRGAYIAAGGKRVDNMVHHSVIKEVIEQYQSKPKET